MPAPNRPRAAAVIVGAGRSTRFGAADKVLAPLLGRPLLAYALDAADTADAVDAVVVVVSDHILSAVQDVIAAGDWTKIRATVTGGDRRQDSVAAGLEAVPATMELVAVHDAARPLVTSALFTACLAAASNADAAIAATPVADTLKQVECGQIVKTIPRAGLWAAQTPQAFRLDLLRRAFVHAEDIGLDVTDESVLLELLGVAVTVVPSTVANLKITHRDDLAVAEALLIARASRRGSPA